MNTVLRAGGFVAALALMFAAAFGIGKLFDDGAKTPYRIDLTASQRGSTVALRFSVLHDGGAVTRFAVRHEKRLHLIVVRKDFGAFRHVHPTMNADGVWSVDTPLPGGEWRAFADFQPDDGSPQVLASDFFVEGSKVVAMTPSAFRVAVGSTLTAGGNGSMLTFRVTRRGMPVTLQPYLGAFGHLVVLRESDMTYLHVHPQTSPADGPIPFHVEVPTGGRYHLYLDYQVGGVVRTASFVLDAGSAGGHGSEMHDMGGMGHGDH